MRTHVLGVERVHPGGGEFGLGVRGCQQFLIPRIGPAGGAHWPTLEPSAQKGPGSRDQYSPPICHVRHDTSIFFLQFKLGRSPESLRPGPSPGSKLWRQWTTVQAPKWILCWPAGKLWLSGNFHAS